MSEADSKHMVEVIEDRFNARLVTELQKAVDEAYVHLATNPLVKLIDAAASQTLETNQDPDREPAKTPRIMREQFIKPILEKKGFSVHDWAKRAKVDFHTANSYLKGETKPYPETRKKLADALGVEVEKLPK